VGLLHQHDAASPFVSKDAARDQQLTARRGRYPIGLAIGVPDLDDRCSHTASDPGDPVFFIDRPRRGAALRSGAQRHDEPAVSVRTALAFVLYAWGVPSPGPELTRTAREQTRHDCGWWSLCAQCSPHERGQWASPLSPVDALAPPAVRGHNPDSVTLLSESCNSNKTANQRQESLMAVRWSTKYIWLFFAGMAYQNHGMCV
jgi:hypothetical protein